MTDTETEQPERALPKLRRELGRKLKIVLLSLVLAPLVLLSLPVIFQNKLIYYPSRYDPAWTPGEGLLSNFRPYTAADGKEQWGYLIPPSGDRDPDAGPGFYLAFYGNASTAYELSEYIEELAEKTGCGFFIPDYRGYGFNKGSPNEKRLTADGLGAYDTLNEEGYFENGVGLWSHSMGGAVAFAVAAERPVDRMIVVSTFTSIEGMAGHLRYPSLLFRFLVNHWPNDERLAELLGRPEGDRPHPIVLFHGRQDEVIPFWMGTTLASTRGPDLHFVPLNSTHDTAHFVAERDIVKVLNGEFPE